MLDDLAGSGSRDTGLMRSSCREGCHGPARVAKLTMPFRMPDTGFHSFSPKTCLVHWQAALRRFSCCLVLDHVPTLGEQTVLDARNANHDPVRRSPEYRPWSMTGHDQRVFLARLRRSSHEQSW